MDLSINSQNYYTNTNISVQKIRRNVPNENIHLAFQSGNTINEFDRFTRTVSTDQEMSWIKDPEIRTALGYLGEIKNLPADVKHLKTMGITPLFQNGQQALDFIKANKINVEFGSLGDSQSHAVWINDARKIVINEKYKGNMNQQAALAISEAIYHEAGHGKDFDGVSSIQEELECLALNSLAYNYHKQTYLDYNENKGLNGLVSNGVALYARLFFDNDKHKSNLIHRVAEKYGDLPVESPNHPTGTYKHSIANKVKDIYLQNTA